MEQNSFVRLKTDPARAGILQPGEKLHAGYRMVPVRFADGQLNWLPESALEPVPPTPESLTDLFGKGRFVDPAWLRQTIARMRVTGRLSEVVYSMEATQTEFYAFQFKPVLKLLNSPTDGLLIADEVGLGKTIEAGLIWTELRARVESNRLLIICPKTLCEKWRIELDRRFGVEAQIVDAAGLVDRLEKSRTSARGFAAIASMQSLRPPRGWQDESELSDVESRSPRLRLARLLDEAADGEPILDLLVIDEAHHMRNPETMLFKLGELLNSVTAHRVFLSATPVHLRNRDLHSLLRLIDPDTFEYESTLDELIQMNVPLLRARDLLLKPGTPAKAVLDCLDEASNFDLLSESRTIEWIKDALRTRPLDNTARAELASRLEQANQLSNYVNRTRRRDVQEFRVVRRPSAPTLQMHEDERLFYTAVTAEVTKYAWERGAGERFLLSMPQRLLTSSPAAASAYWSGPDDGGDEAAEETDADIEVDSADDRPLVSAPAS